VPPLLAGTLQCTRDRVDGGAFRVSLEGIDHYRKYGYKSKKCVDHDNSMIEIPYRFNQLTIHLGNLPHSSTKIEAIHGNQNRVIVGFNVFCKVAGPLVQKAPEHSDAFRKAIKLQKAIKRTTTGSKQMNFDYLRSNKGLTKLLVLAKREHVKKKFQLSQQLLAEEVPKQLPNTVEALMKIFSGKEIGWQITPDDVRVFVHHGIQEGKYEVIGLLEQSSDQLVPLTATLTVAK
jgi:hypothetical protein